MKYNCEKDVFNGAESEEISHPMNSFVETKACKAAENAIKISRDPSLSWKRMSKEGEPSAIGCL